MERFRNLDYLQHELEIYNKSEKENLEENDRSLKRMQKRLREEELRIMRGGEADLKEGKLGDGSRGAEKAPSSKTHSKSSSGAARGSDRARVRISFNV